MFVLTYHAKQSLRPLVLVLRARGFSVINNYDFGKYLQVTMFVLSE